MKILLLHSGNREYHTGIVTHICNLAGSLASRDHDVTVIMFGDHDTEFIKDNVRYMFFPTFYRFFTQIRKEKRKADIVHCHDLLSLAACLPRGRKPYVYTNHSVFADPDFQLSYQEWQDVPKLKLKTRLELEILKISGQYLLKSVNAIAVSNFVRITTSQIYKVPESKIEIIYNGIAINDFKVMNKESDQSQQEIILFVKPNESRKGLHHVLDALPGVLGKVPSVKLIVAGSEPEGDYRAYIQHLLDRYNISDKVVFTGKIPFPDLVSLYQTATIVAMPSVYEAFGIVALEAGVCGKPLVASNVGGIGEVIIHGKTGYLVNTKDPILFANAIIELMQNASLRGEMGENAKKRIQENFTWDKISGDVERVYQKAIGYYSE